MKATQPLLDIIADIYAVPGDASRWAGILERTACLVGGAAGVYLMIDNVESHMTEISCTFGYPPDELRDLYSGDGAAKKDVRYQYLNNLIPGRVFREFEYVPDRQAYDNCEWIQHELKTRGIYWNIAAQVSTHGLWRDIISFNRVKSHGAYLDSEKDTLQALLPHMSRAAELHRTFERLKQLYGMVLAVLDRLLIGVLLLDKGGRFVTMNAAARQAAEDSGAFRARPGMPLHATDSHTDALLRKLVVGAARTAGASGTSDGGALVLPRRGTGPGILFEVMPLRDEGVVDGGGIEGVAVFIVDPARSHVLNCHGLARIFALSPAEGAIATEVINGATVVEIAEERRTTVGTVRGQLKAIFGKTGARSQSDLVRLAAKADPPVDRSGAMDGRFRRHEAEP